MLIKKISESTGLSRHYVSKLIRSASHRYKDYYVKKHTEGLRLISQPSKEVKFLQRWIVDNIFVNLPIHNKVFSYRVGVGIRDIAKRHKNYNYLLKMDFKDFFPSITYKDIKHFLINHKKFFDINLNLDDFDRICSIVCKNKKLTIGSPSSPIISNVILFSFDDYWDNYCKKQNIEYSRYADDIYFSTNTPDLLFDFPKKIKRYLSEMKHPKLIVNDNKTVFTSRKHSKKVTGLVVTSDRNISIGRNQKRIIKSLVHKYCLGTLSEDKISYLRGYISFVNSVDPLFINALKKKYGKNIIESLFREKIITLKNNIS